MSVAPAPPFIPHGELVMKGWLLQVVGVPAAAAELPGDTSSWAERGFVTFLGLGGSPLPNGIRRPGFQLDFWAISPSSGKPPWGKANQLAEIVRAATDLPGDPAWGIRGVDCGTNYQRARVMAVTARTEPRRILADAGAAARYSMDVDLTYVAAS